MAATENLTIELARKPSGKLTPDCFRESAGPVPSPADGQVLVRTILLSVDAANRAWMEGATYRSQVLEGAAMDGYALGEVVESASDRWKPGDLVEGDLGWRLYGVHKAEHLLPTGDHRPLDQQFSALGIAGKTAWHGLFGVGRPQPGETVLVSAAAGSVGCLVGQMAKAHGCRAVGVAGGPEKCAWVRDELGFDACVDYRDGSVLKAIAAQCPDGVDLYFDNVGGPVLEAALFVMNNGGRVVCCGAVSQYDTDQPTSPRGVPGLLVVKRLRMEGFVVMDFADRDAEAEQQIKGWLADGSLRMPVDVFDGLQRAPAALIGLLAGDNKGKRMVRVSPDPS